MLIIDWKKNINFYKIFEFVIDLKWLHLLHWNHYAFMDSKEPSSLVEYFRISTNVFKTWQKKKLE